MANANMARLQQLRRATQLGFFALFLLAPALNLLRFDLQQTQLWVLGCRWSLGIDAFKQGALSANEAALAILLRGILPALLLAAGFLGLAWRYGRVYCGWLCPHFSLVELLNGLLQRASGRLSIWEPASGPRGQGGWWPLFVLSGLFFGFLWAITLLTYLLPPAQIWSGLLHGSLTPNQARFVVIGGLLFSTEMLLARHLFCRFGCAVGLFQSLAWMANPRALVVAFARERASDCRSCNTAQAPEGAACDVACPMRLKPRNIKRLMFSCVQCGQCLRECENSHQQRGQAASLQWTVGLDALRETLKQRRQE
ncbi:4Fe-4S binding protein [Paucibacter sp. APW11]|uniref:4Fe-4S binding protein n=1 Tax=Roseateles aquae TaxID=3077235 RepID=A0ABU3P8I3_9BURK|nr:4Fe-4S binding protein [Paucibacter sp. APW11]MDT8998051.1 4Fe-4S binding protein [Paucibacter sp. APW11]